MKISPEISYPDVPFLQKLFSHRDCIHFNVEEKRQIKLAYSIASEAHVNQIRKNGEAYISHIEGTVDIFLSITRRKPIQAEDIIVAILHDVIEDQPTFIRKVQSNFPRTDVYTRVLHLSKPSVEKTTSVHIEYVRSILAHPSQFYKSAETSFSPQMASGLVFGKNMDSKTREKQSALFAHIQSLRPRDLSTWTIKQTRDYEVLGVIAILALPDFEIKVADRLQNLSCLESVGAGYIERNIISTQVCIYKAEIFGRHDLVKKLTRGVVALEKKRKELSKETVSSPASSPSLQKD